MPDTLQLFSISKFIHMTTVALTITGFLVRGIWMLRESPLLNLRITKTLPHVNDTLLLVSALSTAALLGQYPFVNVWLTAKVIGLISYILLGAVALSYGATRGIRTSAYIGAILSFAYVVFVAFTKNPMIF